jgi:hypothetical protein
MERYREKYRNGNIVVTTLGQYDLSTEAGRQGYETFRELQLSEDPNFKMVQKRIREERLSQISTQAGDTGEGVATAKGYNKNSIMDPHLKGGDVHASVENVILQRRILQKPIRKP